MTTKTIVVLAVSKKPGGRCLAGKELFQKNGAWEIGSWIRPVTTENSGAVPEYQMSLALGRTPRLLEIIEIPFVKPVPMRDQPENWLIEMPMKPKSWNSHGVFTWKDIGMLIDKPDFIWSEPSNQRRVKSGYVPKMKNPASLYLIKPQRIQSIKVWSESNQFQQSGAKRRRRVVFDYAGATHEFDIDDTDFQNKYYPKFPGLNDSPVYPKLQNPEGTIICVSLALEHVDHYHYKIAAAFLEPPH